MIKPQIEELYAKLGSLESGFKTVLKNTKTELKNKINDVQTPINFMVSDIRSQQAGMLAEQ